MSKVGGTPQSACDIDQRQKYANAAVPTTNMTSPSRVNACVLMDYRP